MIYACLLCSEKHKSTAYVSSQCPQCRPGFVQNSRAEIPIQNEKQYAFASLSVPAVHWHVTVILRYTCSSIHVAQKTK